MRYQTLLLKGSLTSRHTHFLKIAHLVILDEYWAKCVTKGNALQNYNKTVFKAAALGTSCTPPLPRRLPTARPSSDPGLLHQNLLRVRSAVCVRGGRGESVGQE